MTRPIKFRAMSEGGRWNYFGLHDLAEDNVLQRMFPTFKHVSQFTGLHDKNGKEIFSGDFLIDDDSEPMRHRIVWDEWGAKFEMETLEDEEGHWSSGICDYLADAIEAKDTPRLKHFEVIGNIYENPELLK